MHFTGMAPGLGPWSLLLLPLRYPAGNGEFWEGMKLSKGFHQHPESQSRRSPLSYDPIPVPARL